MNQYITGKMIKKRREESQMTQAEFASKLKISDKTVSKWETGKGYPDITMVEEIAKILGISVIELFSGNDVVNSNVSANMLQTHFYVCPICGNVIHSVGEIAVSCHGITLLPLEAEECDENHEINIEKVEDELYIVIDHEMSKQHYISFIAAVSDNGLQLIKFYPESNAEARFKINRVRYLYLYCNRHGLYKIKAPRFPRNSGIIKQLKA